MAQNPNPPSLIVNTVHQQAFQEIFNLIANKPELLEKEGKKPGEGDNKINKEGLSELFKLIDYKTTEEQFNDICKQLFAVNERITFDNFLQIFNLKLEDYTITDVKNAFKLLAGDDDKLISLDKIKSILERNGLSDMEIIFLMNQLSTHCEGNNMVRYMDFLQSLNI